MKTFDGYLKLKFGDTYLLLAGGGEKKLTDLLTLFERPANTNNILLTVGGTLLTVNLGSMAFDSGTYWPLFTDSYPCLRPGSSNNWIQIGTANTSYGIIPSQSGGAGNGHNYIGTSSWYWKYAYIDLIYGYLNGDISGNADTVDSLHAHTGRNNEANKLVRTDGYGYIQAGYINSSDGDENNNSSPNRVWGTNGSDSYLRTYRTSALSVNYANSAGQVTINYSNDSNSTYQMLWGSGNSVYGTGGIYCNPYTDYLYSGSFYCGNWFRSSGATGWYNESYGGGIYMEDSTYVRTYNGKQFYVSNGGEHAIYTAGSFATAKSGGCFSMYNGSSWYYDIFYNHWNGNLSFDAPGGSLFLAYYRGNIYFAGGSYYIDRSGNTYFANYYSTSDRSKKQNISSFSEHIRKFQLKDTEKYAYGVIAQEVPEMFRDGEEGNMTVNYNSILSYYIGELENKVQKLENEIKQLKRNNKWLH